MGAPLISVFRFSLKGHLLIRADILRTKIFAGYVLRHPLIISFRQDTKQLASGAFLDGQGDLEIVS